MKAGRAGAAGAWDPAAVGWECDATFVGAETGIAGLIASDETTAGSAGLDDAGLSAAVGKEPDGRRKSSSDAGNLGGTSLGLVAVRTSESAAEDAATVDGVPNDTAAEKDGGADAPDPGVVDTANGADLGAVAVGC